MVSPELSRMIDLRHLPEMLRIEADPAERGALAGRLGLEAIERFEADTVLTRDGAAVAVTGRIAADIVQLCAASGDPFPTRIAEDFALRFVPAADTQLPDELELSSEDCDEIAFEGTQFDLGEAVAQTLSLAIDPYATGPTADAARQEAGLDEPELSGPFAALAKLKR